MTTRSEPTEAASTVLIVEDEAELRFILRAHLRAAGFTTLEAVDGCEAVKLTIDHLPDLVIMDIGLPVMDGVAATRALKADVATASIPVIMLTARSSADDIVRGLEAGAQEYVAKPFDMTELMARVQTIQRLVNARKDLNRLNTRLEAEVDSKTMRLQIHYEFMRDLNRAGSRDEILDLILHCVGKMTGAKRTSLLLKDATGDNLVCERAVGIDRSIVEKIKVKAPEGIAGQVFQSGKTFAARTYGMGTAAGADYDRDAFISTPLMSTSLETHDGVIGVLNVTDKDEDTPFSEDEIECIRSIADAGAIALDNMIRRERLQHSVRILLQTVGRLAEYRDEETTLHLERVTTMARILAANLQREGPYVSQVNNGFIESLVQAAPMHDIGKVGIPDEILTKPGKLTNEEFQIMKTHADIGRRVLSQAVDPAHPVPLLEMCIDIAHSHHERFDGSGYPRRLPGEQIPLSARIIALVDAYDAITSERRYKAAKPHRAAVDIIRAEAGHHFDPALVEAFLRCHEQFDKVRSSFNETAEPPAVAVAHASV